jgi:hypothetical protein
MDRQERSDEEMIVGSSSKLQPIDPDRFGLLVGQTVDKVQSIPDIIEAYPWLDTVAKSILEDQRTGN